MNDRDTAWIAPPPPPAPDKAPGSREARGGRLRHLAHRVRPRPLETPALRQRFEQHFHAAGLFQAVMSIMLATCAALLGYLAFGLSGLEAGAWFAGNQVDRLLLAAVLVGFLVIALAYWDFWQQHWQVLALTFVLSLYGLSALTVLLRAGAQGPLLTEAECWRAVSAQCLVVLVTFPFIRLRLSLLVAIALLSSAALVLSCFADSRQAGNALIGLAIAIAIGCAVWYGTYWRERELFARSLALEHALADARRAEGTAREAEATATELADRQRKLARAITHDIRQPMTAIGIQMMLVSEACANNPKITAALEPLAFALDALHSQVEEIAADAQSGARPTVELAPVNVHRLVTMAVQLHAPLARRFQIELTNWVAPSAQDVCGLTNVGHLATILQSLIGNAIKFRRGTPGLSPRVICVGLTRVRGRISIRVFDNGIGIPRTTLPRIFDEGFSTDNDRSRSSGLGLFNVRRLLEPMQGHDVGVVSRPWQFTCFRITLPVTEQTAATGQEAAFFADALESTIPETSPGTLEGRQVLLVEDDPLVASTLNFLLTRAGARTTIANNHAEAIASLDDQSTPPELLICDYDLDDPLTGVDVIRDVRERFGRTIPAIMISGELDRLQAGQIDLPLIMKPFVSETLFRAIEHALRAPEQAPIKA